MLCGSPDQVCFQACCLAGLEGHWNKTKLEDVHREEARVTEEKKKTANWSSSRNSWRGRECCLSFLRLRVFLNYGFKSGRGAELEALVRRLSSGGVPPSHSKRLLSAPTPLKVRWQIFMSAHVRPSNEGSRRRSRAKSARGVHPSPSLALPGRLVRGAAYGWRAQRW